MKCIKCGYENMEGVSKCGKCGKLLSKTKSCPKCATRNNIDALKCKKCGYKFNKSSKSSIILNLIISCLVVLFLGVLLFLDKVNLVENIQFCFKIFAVVLILFIFIGSMRFSKKMELNRTIPELAITNNNIKKIKRFSKIMFVILGFIVIGFCIYFYLKFIY